VDSQFIPSQFLASDDPHTLPHQKGAGENALEDHISNQRDEYWGFRVALAYPRMEIPWKPAKKLSDVGQLKGGGQVVVETITGGHSSVQHQNGNGDDADDGYHTEDSE